MILVVAIILKSIGVESEKYGIVRKGLRVKIMINGWRDMETGMVKTC